MIKKWFKKVCICKYTKPLNIECKVVFKRSFILFHKITFSVLLWSWAYCTILRLWGLELKKHKNIFIFLVSRWQCSLQWSWLWHCSSLLWGAERLSQLLNHPMVLTGESGMEEFCVLTTPLLMGDHLSISLIIYFWVLSPPCGLLLLTN